MRTKVQWIAAKCASNNSRQVHLVVDVFMWISTAINSSRLRLSMSQIASLSSMNFSIHRLTRYLQRSFAAIIQFILIIVTRHRRQNIDIRFMFTLHLWRFWFTCLVACCCWFSVPGKCLSCGKVSEWRHTTRLDNEDKLNHNASFSNRPWKFSDDADEPRQPECKLIINPCSSTVLIIACVCARTSMVTFHATPNTFPS